MRPQPEIETETATAARNITRISPPPHPSCDPHIHSCRWWPYSDSNDFGANTAVILIALLCALICALALNTAIRWFLRSGNHSQRNLPQTQPQLQQQQQQKRNIKGGTAPLVVAPTLTYSAGMKLGGAEADCAICLSEFEEGEGIRVLGRCNHGFHVHCIEQWLSSHSSCPTCRSSCLASSPETDNCCPGNCLNDTSQPAVPAERAPDHTTTP